MSKTKLVSLQTALYSITLSVLKHNNGSSKVDALCAIVTREGYKILEWAEKERERKSLTPKTKKLVHITIFSEYGAGKFEIFWLMIM